MNPPVAFEPDLGRSGWQAILPARQPSGPLQADIEADYCVVGAGFAGLAAARRLLQLDRNAKVVILEATHVGSGPAGRNSGFMVDLPHVLSSTSYAGEDSSDKRDIQLNRRAIEFVGDAVQTYHLPEEAFRQEGKINAAASRSGVRGNENYARHLDKLGEPFELLGSSDMQSISGTGYYQGGLRTPGSALIQPAMLVQGIADGLARSTGCRLYEQSPVISFSRQGDRCKLKTSNGSVLASKTLLAVNGFVENFGYYRHRLMHVTLYASMTRALSKKQQQRLGGLQRWGFTPSDPFGTTVRKIDDSGGCRLVVRNYISYDPSLTQISNRLSQAQLDHRRAFEGRFPMLSDVSMEYRWSGRLCLSRNNAWAIGEVEPNVYSACCQNGLGTTKGIVAGVIAAEQASGYTDVSLMPEYQPGELPSKLLPEPFMTAGANLYLTMREWRAGRDK